MLPFALPIQVGHCYGCVSPDIQSALDAGQHTLVLVDGPGQPYAPFKVDEPLFSTSITSGVGSVINAATSPVEVAGSDLSLTGVKIVKGSSGSLAGLHCSGGSTVDAHGSTFSGGDVGRAIAADECNVFLDGATIVERGGVRLDGDSALMASDTTFQDSDSGDEPGGAILAQGGSVLLDGCTFSNNRTRSDGGAIELQGGSLLHLDDGSNRFSGDHADGNGGAIHASGGGLVDLAGDGFEGEDAGLGGGAISLQKGATLIASACTFEETRAQKGGAIASESSALSVYSSSFTDTASSAEGGAIAIDGSYGEIDLYTDVFDGTGSGQDGGAVSASYVDELDFAGCTFEGTRSGARGGAVAVLGDAGHVAFDRCSFRDVAAVGEGGAVRLELRGTATVRRTEICGASASRGGALAVVDAAATLTNDGFGGTSADEGAVLSSQGQASVALDQVTVHGATAPGYGGSTAAILDEATLQVSRSILGDAAIPLANRPAQWSDVWANVDPGPIPGVSAGPIDWLAGADGGACGVELRILPGSAVARGPGPRDDLGEFGGAGADDAWDFDRDGDGVPYRYDCADDDPGVGAGLEEVCDGVDQDCDGEIDEDLPEFVADRDGDGWWDASVRPTCAPGPGLVPKDQVRSGDCDDDDPAVHPGAVQPAGVDTDFDCDGTWFTVQVAGGGCDASPRGDWFGAILVGFLARIRRPRGTVRA